MRIDELRAGKIPHALAMNIPWARKALLVAGDTH